MRVFAIVIVQLAVSAFLTASVMPFVLVSVPAVQAEPRIGLGLTAVAGAGFYALLALAWRWRRT